MRPKLMNRTNIYLSDRQVKTFKELSKKKGLTVAELIRRILDEWLDGQQERG